MTMYLDDADNAIVERDRRPFDTLHAWFDESLYLDTNTAPSELLELIHYTPLSWLALWLYLQDMTNSLRLTITVSGKTIYKTLIVASELQAGLYMTDSGVTVRVSIPQYKYDEDYQLSLESAYSGIDTAGDMVHTLTEADRYIRPMSEAASDAYSVLTVSFSADDWLSTLLPILSPNGVGEITATYGKHIPVTRYLVELPIDVNVLGILINPDDELVGWIDSTGYLRTKEYVAVLTHSYNTADVAGDDEGISGTINLNYMLYPVGLWDTEIQPHLRILHLLQTYPDLLADPEYDDFMQLWGAATVDELAEGIDVTIRSPTFHADWWMHEAIGFTHLAPDI
jgi:hypothetical protein